MEDGSPEEPVFGQTADFRGREALYDPRRPDRDKTRNGVSGFEEDVEKSDQFCPGLLHAGEHASGRCLCCG